MKIIDLLNKIANDEEIPKKIKFNNYIYAYHDKEHGYCRHNYDCTYICMNAEYHLFDILNDEIEIIEEDNNKIEHFGWCTIIDHNFKEKKKKQIEMETDIQNLGRKLNEIIDKLNGDN